MHRTRRGALACAAAGFATLAGCNEASDGLLLGGQSETNAPSATPGDAAKTVTMRGVTGAARISPAGLYVEPGETVVFAVENGPHSSRAYHPDNGTELRIPEAAEPWRTPVLSAGQSVRVTPTVEGTYDYYCATHLNHGQVGRLVVGQPGGPAEGSMPPGGEVPDSETIVEEGTGQSPG